MRRFLPRAGARWLRASIVLISSGPALAPWLQQGLSVPLTDTMQRKVEPEWSWSRAWQPASCSSVHTYHPAQFGGSEGCFPLCAHQAKAATPQTKVLSVGNAAPGVRHNKWRAWPALSRRRPGRLGPLWRSWLTVLPHILAGEKPI